MCAGAVFLHTRLVVEEQRQQITNKLNTIPFALKGKHTRYRQKLIKITNRKWKMLILCAVDQMLK